EAHHRLGGEQGANPAGAVEGDRRGPVGDPLLEEDLDVALADVDGAGHVTGLVLVALADVDEDPSGEHRPRVDVLGGHLGDDRPGSGEEILSGHRHDSDSTGAPLRLSNYLDRFSQESQAAGRLNQKRADPGGASTPTRPPAPSTSCLTMARPIPAPPRARSRDFSTR